MCPDPGRAAERPQAPQAFRGFHRGGLSRLRLPPWAERLIDLLQRVADGELSRLIVCCPPRLGKTLLVSKLFPAYWVSRYPHLLLRDRLLFGRAGLCPQP